MNFLNKYNYIAASIATIILSACGGGSSESSNPATGIPPDTSTPPDPVLDTSNHAFSVTVDDGLPPLLIDKVDSNEHLSADTATTDIQNNDAFSQAIPAIVQLPEWDAVFKAGDHTFRSNHDGEGPLFNNTSCQGCHIKDGRGEVPSSNIEPMMSMLLKVGSSKGSIDPIYGAQLQVFGVIEGKSGPILAKYQGAINEGLSYGEAYTWVEYELQHGEFADGTSYTLRKPIYKVKDLAYGDFNEDVRFSARVTPHVYGSGLIESIPESSILVYADPNDSNNDGISGRAAYTSQPITGVRQLARFGQKAVTGSILQQISGAYRGDMGVTNTIKPEEPCTSLQTACNEQALLENNKHHDGVDLNNVDLAQVEFYNRTLAVPKRRGFNEENNTWNTDVLAGRALFYKANCHSCHVPRHKTGRALGSVLGDVDLLQIKDTKTNINALENLVIYPYTDLLLHDMGGTCEVTRELASGESCSSGELCFYVQRCDGLADGRPEGDATGVEWKTPPLWGIGLVKTVNPKATFLHDGRALTIEEAILWHGGEALAAQKGYINMTKEERSNLQAFLNSL
ncbi:di-heme oxidoredictase family protein [Pseudoalteromonas aurantia]|uniref:Thiol oxidoreductase n=2 Tax=Pseudoalteromonas TaxID=53246 RepID=A0A5S3VCC1_9GAMM|nr:di-heme oxidoredictase family protein [Pseudoalteromonas aurantia]TMO61027.1 thiol oxidoreductase [Pseudoalteromonas aurantia]TMO69653.1 thiol oxidoreductase [Pseudoalteromonas aurantia]TMO75758.1 thiol oxidoreductase [Pseudoalteromonas aurantia]